MKATVSIIIPIYNAEKTLTKTLNSIVTQTYCDYEVILVDDGSNDNSESICKSFCLKDKRFVYMRQENQGVSLARNAGINKSNGRYLVFVDADDCLKSDALEILVNFQEKNKGYLICTSYLMKKTRGRKKEFLLKNCTSLKQDSNFLKVLDSVPTAPWGKIFIRDVIVRNNIEFPANIPYGEDTIFLYRYLQYARGVITSEKICYEYDYTNISSAGRKYYRDFYLYMKAQYDQKKLLLENSTIDQSVYLDRCIEHYCINIKNKSTLTEMIRKSIGVFNQKSISNDCDVQEIIQQWKIKNFSYYLKEKATRFFKHI